MNFIKNLFKEVDNNPALMIIIWSLFITLFVSTYNGFIDLIFIIANLIFIAAEVKRYRRKY